MATTNEIINTALQILKSHDFDWRMSDYAYTSGIKEYAKNHMRHYVDVIKQLPANLYQLMRELWIAEFDYNRCFAPYWVSEDATKCKAEKERLRAEVDAILKSNIAFAA